jgi:hypothetical protein
MSIGLVLLVSVGFLFSLMVGSIWLVNFAAKRIVGDKHHTLELIAANDEVPESWCRAYSDRVSRLEEENAPADRIRDAKRREGGKILKRLDKLLAYVDHTPLVSDEQTRKDLTDKLEAVYDKWDEEVPE